jgi:hypothetical protein
MIAQKYYASKPLSNEIKQEINVTQVTLNFLKSLLFPDTTQCFAGDTEVGCHHIL